MGEENTIPMRINKVEGVAGQVKISGGPGVLETWGAPAPAAHTHAASDVTSGQFPLARMPRAATGNFLEGNGVGADPIFNALVEANIPNHMAKGKLAWTLNKLLLGAGAGVDPTEIDVPSPGASINTGTYTGNNTANRAITHGLGMTPKVVFIVSGADGRNYREMTGNAFIYDTQDDAFYSVTVMNATNFYVGNAAHYSNSANATGTGYTWVAIG